MNLLVYSLSLLLISSAGTQDDHFNTFPPESYFQDALWLDRSFWESKAPFRQSPFLFKPQKNDEKRIRNEVHYETKDVFVISDRNPLADFHYLVIPQDTSVTNCYRLRQNHLPLLLEMEKACYKVLKQKVHRLDKSKIRMGFHMPPFYSVNHLHLHCQYGTFNFPTISNDQQSLFQASPFFKQSMKTKNIEEMKYIQMKYDSLTYPYKPITKAISEIMDYGKVKAIRRYHDDPFIFHQDDEASYYGKKLGLGNPSTDIYAVVIYEEINLLRAYFVLFDESNFYKDTRYKIQDTILRQDLMLQFFRKTT